MKFKLEAISVLRLRHKEEHMDLCLDIFQVTSD